MFKYIKQTTGDKSISFNPETDFVGFESRSMGSGFELECYSDFSYDEELPANHHRVVACYDQGKDKWQTTGITDWCWVGDPKKIPVESREGIQSKRQAQNELEARWQEEQDDAYAEEVVRGRKEELALELENMENNLK